MESRNIPPPGKLVTVQDLVALSDWLHSSVNVTGRLHEHDVASCRAKLGAAKCQHYVTIDTTLVEPFHARLGSLYQFIGEVKVDGDDKENAVVQARVVRNCDGLDLVQYNQALRTQREYLESRKNEVK